MAFFLCSHTIYRKDTITLVFFAAFDVKFNFPKHNFCIFLLRKSFIEVKLSNKFVQITKKI